jgi:hypothetical protein
MQASSLQLLPSDICLGQIRCSMLAGCAAAAVIVTSFQVCTVGPRQIRRAIAANAESTLWLLQQILQIWFECR